MKTNSKFFLICYPFFKKKKTKEIQLLYLPYSFLSTIAATINQLINHSHRSFCQTDFGKSNKQRKNIFIIIMRGSGDKINICEIMTRKEKNNGIKNLLNIYVPAK